jgi:hypothetical protein
MSVVLDAGALVAIERGDRDMVAEIKSERLKDRAPLTHGGVIGQVWRGGTGARPTRPLLLRGVEVRAIDDSLGRQVGVLLGSSGATDVVDAAVVLIAGDGDEIFPSDPADLTALAYMAGRHVELISV